MTHILQTYYAPKRASRDLDPKLSMKLPSTKRLRNQDCLDMDTVTQYLPEQNMLYYRQELTGTPQGGLSALVEKSYKDCSHWKLGNQFPNLDENQQAMLDFKLANLIRSTSRSNAEEVINIVSQYYLLGQQQAKMSHTNVILPPFDYNEARSRYLRNSKSSIAQIVPIPAVLDDIPGHAYSPITDCLRVCLVSAAPMECISMSTTTAEEIIKTGKQSKPYSWITDSPRAAEILHRISSQVKEYGSVHAASSIVVPYLLWQDAVDPNNTKNNKFSVWFKSVTFGTPRDDRNNPKNTFLMALGKKDNHHQAFEERLAADCHLLRSRNAPNYIRRTAKSAGVYKVYADLFAVLADQPERREANELALGGQHYHARFKVSCDHAKLITKLRPCVSCLEQMRGANQGPHNHCKQCINWDVLDSGPDSPDVGIEPTKYYPVLDNHYPNKQTQNVYIRDGKIYPFETNYERLAASAELAFTQLVQQKWSKDNAKAFLRREVFSNSFIEKIIQHSLNARALSRAQDCATNESQQSRSKVILDAQSFPHKYKIPDFPIPWQSGHDLSVYVDVIMHLFFLGIVKSVLLSLKVWMARQNKHSKFLDGCKIKNKLLMNNKLEWFPFEPYKGQKFGGWVSESYLAFSRVMLWFYQDLLDYTELKDEERDDNPPSDKPDSNWKKKHYKRWLKVRGLKAKRKDSNGKPIKGMEPTLDDYKREVKEALSQPGGPPNPKQPQQAFDSFQVERCLISLHKLLKVVMCEEVVPGTTVEEMKLRVRHFLSEFDLLDQQIKDAKETPKVISSYNFVCLLNLPTLTQRFGPLRNLWEGGFKGEGIAKPGKKYLKRGERKNCYKNALIHLHKDYAFNRIKEDNNMHVQNPPPPSSLSDFLRYHVGKNFKVNKAWEEVASQTVQMAVISVVVLDFQDDNSKRMICCVVRPKPKGSLALHQLLTDTTKPPIMILGMRYYKYSVSHTIYQCDSSLPTNVSFGMLLPLLDVTKGGFCHTLVTHDRYSH